MLGMAAPIVGATLGAVALGRQPRQFAEPVRARGPADVYAELLAAERVLPEYLRLGPDIGVAESGAAANQWYAQNIAPKVSEMESEMGRTGQNRGSFGAGRIAALESAGRQGAQAAGDAAAQAALQRRIAARNALFGNAGMVGGGGEDTARAAQAQAQMAQQVAAAKQEQIGRYVMGAFGALQEASPYLESGGKWLWGKMTGKPAVAQRAMQPMSLLNSPFGSGYGVPASSPYDPQMGWGGSTGFGL